MANLLQAAGSTDTTLFVDDTSNMPVDGGTVLIGSEVIAFGTATDRSLINCTRGVQGTSAASHTAGSAITLLESFPFAQTMGTSPSWVTVGMKMPHLALLDPVAVLTRAQIEANAMVTVTLDGSGANQTWTLPKLQQSQALMLVIALASPASFSLTVNTVSITAGTAQMFMWDGLAWYSVA